MKHIFHPAESRGHVNHGWLNSFHSFSFASYLNPERVNFGALRVLNDDWVSPSMGFSKHPHSNMEIVSIPLEGKLEHKDSMGNITVIKSGEVQIMSAGTGVEHSEKNNSNDTPVKFLQIWVFPKEQNIKPNYDQKVFSFEGRKNKFQKVVSPKWSEEAGVKINQDSWFSLADLEEGYSLDYKMNLPKNGVYFFLLEGEIEIEGQKLKKRDSFGVWEVENVNVVTKTGSQLLAIEVPMEI